MNLTPTLSMQRRDQVTVKLVTFEDLFTFKSDLLNEIRKVFRDASGQPVKQLLKSHEGRKLLGISPGTLQHLRENGTIPFTKLGSVIYYDYEQIKKVLQTRKRPTL